MKILYTSDTLEIVMTESHDDSLSLDHNWCTKQASMYKVITEKLNQKLFQITFKDNYLLGLAINNKNVTGQWIDNVKDDNNRFAQISLNYLKDDIFNSNKVLEIAKLKNNPNLEVIAQKLSELPDDAKNAILSELI